MKAVLIAVEAKAARALEGKEKALVEVMSLRKELKMAKDEVLEAEKKTNTTKAASSSSSSSSSSFSSDLLEEELVRVKQLLKEATELTEELQASNDQLTAENKTLVDENQALVSGGNKGMWQREWARGSEKDLCDGIDEGKEEKVV